MTSDQKTVFVLGAGFTKAFVPEAPLLTDNYRLNEDRFEKLSNAHDILESEKRLNFNGNINIERLMTRLDGKMPYDLKDTKEELNLLLSEVKQAFNKKLEEAKKCKIFNDDLEKFAEYCYINHITCITFNYDDVLDEALHKSAGDEWEPDGGYGFFLKPSEQCIRQEPRHEKGNPAILLLKLHGSINWRVKRGSSHPYSIDAIVHHETWSDSSKVDPQDIDLHIETEPFIIPPVLMKSVLVEQPILRLTWSLAYRKLQEAEQIIFIGYSFPVTDVAAGFLFSEAIQRSCKISVVNLQKDDNGKEQIRQVYKKVFPEIDIQFHFDGALEWSRRIVSHDS